MPERIFVSSSRNMKKVREKREPHLGKLITTINQIILSCVPSVEIQALMGSLLYIPSDIESSPYSYLFDTSLWDDIRETFLKDACARLGLSVDSPLAVW